MASWDTGSNTMILQNDDRSSIIGIMINWGFTKKGTFTEVPSKVVINF